MCLLYSIFEANHLSQTKQCTVPIKGSEISSSVSLQLENIQPIYINLIVFFYYNKNLFKMITIEPGVYSCRV